MKKVLLSLSILVAAMAANAQTLIPIYGGNPLNAADSVNSATGFTSFAPVAPATVPADWVNEEVTEASGNVYLHQAGTGTYYVWGASNGCYTAAGAAKSFGYAGTAAGYVVLRAKAAANKPLSKIKISLVTTDQTKSFGAEISEAGAFGVDPSLQMSTSWKTYNLAFASFRQEDANGNQIGASPIAPTAADLAAIGQVNVICNVQSCSWNGTACDVAAQSSDICVDDIYMSQNSMVTVTPIPTGTLAAASNIASTKVFPNPTEGSFNVELNLKSSVSASIIVTDMMGRQVAVKNVTSGVNTEFNTSGFAKGVYTVTYVLDGTPAKSELVVVR